MLSTIVAPATPPGESAIAVIRVSGSEARAVLARVFFPFRKGPWRSGRMRYGELRLRGEAIDLAMAVWLRGPHTYTGEDSAELYVHGNPLIVAEAVAACVEAGAEHAGAGEFTLRAFQNGKLDLAQAEAVMELISARTGMERNAALRKHRGEAARAVAKLQDALTDLLAEVEAELNYPEEDLPNLDLAEVAARVKALAAALERARDTALAAEKLRRGIRVVLAGATNAGKSSLLNALSGTDRVMVSETHGTTRDVVECEAQIGGIRMILCDTAGLRESGDALEREGQRRTLDAIASADAVLFVLDGAGSMNWPEVALPEGMPVIRVLNKSDLVDPARRGKTSVDDGLWVSARTGEGLDVLRSKLAGRFAVPAGEDWLSGARAQGEAEEALAALGSAGDALGKLPLDILAEELREAWRRLGAITGQTVDEDIVARVFERFCLGK